MLQPKQILLFLAIHHEGDWEKMYADIRNKDMVNLYGEKTILDTCNAYTGNFITILDKEYPESIKRGLKPPFVLFYEGDINLLTSKTPKVAVLNSRTTSDKKINDYLLDHTPFINVMGGSVVDGNIIEDHKENKYIVIFGEGLQNNSIKTVKNNVVKGKGLALSQYPTGTITNSYHYLSRCSTIASVCDKVLVVSSKKKGSQMVIVNMALYNGKDILVVPTNLDLEDSINNELLLEGAIPVTNKDQLDKLALENC